MGECCVFLKRGGGETREQPNKVGSRGESLITICKIAEDTQVSVGWDSLQQAGPPARAERVACAGRRMEQKVREKEAEVSSRLPATSGHPCISGSGPLSKDSFTLKPYFLPPRQRDVKDPSGLLEPRPCRRPTACGSIPLAQFLTLQVLLPLGQPPLFKLHPHPRGRFLKGAQDDAPKLTVISRSH